MSTTGLSFTRLPVAPRAPHSHCWVPDRQRHRDPYRIPGGFRRSGSGRCELSRPEEKILSDAVRKPGPLENRILAGLSRKEYARVAPDLQHVTLSADQVLYEPGVAMHWAYFLDTATVSILSQAESGASIEVSLVGNEGVIGIPIVFRTLKLPYRVVVHGPGTARRMKADVLRKEFDRCRRLHELLLQYVHTLIIQLAQSSACNQFHTIRQRLCRWLLTSQDLSGSDELRSTQESLSQMLGVNRGSANQAAGSLQKAGLIRYRRGHITILSRSGLETAVCECYGIIRTEFGRFFPR